jgi:hypothetical protein
MKNWKKNRLGIMAIVLLFAAVSALASGGTKDLPTNLAGLAGPFDLAGPRTAEVQEFVQETRLVHMNMKGQRTGTETLTLRLRFVPSALRGKPGDEYTCLEFSLRKNDGEPVTIPALAGWTHVFLPMPTGMDEKGQVFGIPHDKFEDLVDSRGAKLDVEHQYFVYNSFIDFHAFDALFARPTSGGGGLQDLKVPGQAIVHAAAFTEPPVNLGKGIKAGSYFRNGEIKLAFKGLGFVDGRACAVIGFDSGESTFKMIMPMGPNMDIVTDGGSEYIGDISIDLESLWVRKVTLDEFVVSETLVPVAGQAGAAASQGMKIQGYTVRHLLTRLVEKGA